MSKQLTIEELLPSSEEEADRELEKITGILHDVLLILKKHHATTDEMSFLAYLLGRGAVRIAERSNQHKGKIKIGGGTGYKKPNPKAGI